LKQFLKGFFVYFHTKQVRDELLKKKELDLSELAIAEGDEDEDPDALDLR
jgi:hypothetical protein